MDTSFTPTHAEVRALARFAGTPVEAYWYCPQCGEETANVTYEERCDNYTNGDPCGCPVQSMDGADYLLSPEGALKVLKKIGRRFLFRSKDNKWEVQDLDTRRFFCREQFGETVAEAALALPQVQALVKEEENAGA